MCAGLRCPGLWPGPVGTGKPVLRPWAGLHAGCCTDLCWRQALGKLGEHAHHTWCHGRYMLAPTGGMLQACSDSYLQAAVAFGHPISSRLMAALLKPLAPANWPHIQPLSSALLCLAHLGHLDRELWQQAVETVLDTAAIPGKPPSVISFSRQGFHACVKTLADAALLPQTVRLQQVRAASSTPGCFCNWAAQARTYLCRNTGRPERCRWVTLLCGPGSGSDYGLADHLSDSRRSCGGRQQPRPLRPAWRSAGRWPAWACSMPARR